jgi:hypothetical protein
LRETIDEVITALLGRLDDIRERHEFDYARWLRISALVFGAGLLLGLGVLTAVAASGGVGEKRVYVANSPGLVTSSSARLAAQPQVVTQTVNRKGETVRVIRHRTTKGDVVLRTVTGPATVQGALVTVKDTRTVREVNTVTLVQEVTVQTPPVTMTVFETVTCTPNDC